MRNAATMINEFLKPGKNEVNKHGQVRQVYQQRMKNGFDEALQMLRQQAGLGPVDSLRLLANSLPGGPPFDRWRQRANRLIAGHRLARQPGQGRSAVPRDSTRPG
jgi:hypothetical protein